MPVLPAQGTDQLSNTGQEPDNAYKAAGNADENKINLGSDGRKHISTIIHRMSL